MAKKYHLIRMPEDIFQRYKGIKLNMEKDISKVMGKPVRLTMPKVFRAVASPEINENYIQISMEKLIKLAKSKQR